MCEDGSPGMESLTPGGWVSVAPPPSQGGGGWQEAWAGGPGGGGVRKSHLTSVAG